MYNEINFESWLVVDTAHYHCSPTHGKYRDTPRYYDVDYPLLRMLPAHTTTWYQRVNS